MKHTKDSKDSEEISKEIAERNKFQIKKLRQKAINTFGKGAFENECWLNDDFNKGASIEEIFKAQKITKNGTLSYKEELDILDGSRKSYGDAGKTKSKGTPISYFAIKVKTKCERYCAGFNTLEINSNSLRNYLTKGKDVGFFWISDKALNAERFPIFERSDYATYLTNRIRTSALTKKTDFLKPYWKYSDHMKNEDFYVIGMAENPDLLNTGLIVIGDHRFMDLELIGDYSEHMYTDLYETIYRKNIGVIKEDKTYSVEIVISGETNKNNMNDTYVFVLKNNRNVFYRSIDSMFEFINFLKAMKRIFTEVEVNTFKKEPTSTALEHLETYKINEIINTPKINNVRNLNFLLGLSNYIKFVPKK